MSCSVEKEDDLQELKELSKYNLKSKHARLEENQRWQGFHYDTEEFFEPCRKTVKKRQTKLEESKATVAAIEKGVQKSPGKSTTIVSAKIEKYDIIKYSNLWLKK